ncbi:MAG: PAS domain S-box protein [Myxococcota bacterium]
MAASQPLDAVLLTCDLSTAELFETVDDTGPYPWALRVEQNAYDLHAQVVFLHASLPDPVSALRAVVESGCAVIVLVEPGDVASAVEMMRLGAVDCVEWGATPLEDLPRRAWRAWAQHRRKPSEIEVPDSQRSVELDRQLAALNELAAQNIHDVIWQSDAEVSFTYVSPSANRLLGYPVESLVGRSLFELLTKSSARETRLRLNRVLERVHGGDAGAGEPLEIELVRVDGECVWAEVVATPIVGADGELTGFTGVTRDVTDRKRAQDELARREELFRAFLNQSTEGFAIIDDRKQVREWNGALEKLTRVPRQQAIGSFATDVVTRALAPDKRSEAQAWLGWTLDELLAGGSGVRSAPMDCSFVYPDGAKRTVRCVLFSVEVQAERRVGIIMHDTTAVREVEQELREIDMALQEASKMEAMGRLAGGVAHDFNNLLTAIAANLELAIQSVREGETPERELLDVALSCTKEAEGVTRQLLAFSKRQVVERVPVDVDALVSGLESMLVRTVGEQIQIRTYLAAGACRVSADPAQLEQIVVNLVLNAAEATRRGGEVLISTMVFVAAEGYRAAGSHHPGRRNSVRAGRYVALEVVDTGRGMTDEVKKRLFEPFFSTKRGGHGVGLGLAAMHGIVEQAGGFVEVFSELERGTRIRVCWPAMVEQPAASMRRSGLQARLPLGNETIMFVEDEQSIRFVANRVLKRTGYKVLLAASGEEALEIGEAFRGHVDLLISDVVMPGINGRALAERWEKIHPESAVLLTSGHTEDVLVQQGVVAGEFAFLSKPYTVDQLAKRVRELLDSRGVALGEQVHP